MNIVLWALQVSLAAVFAWHGWLYLASSEAALNAWHQKQHPGGEPLGVPPTFRHFIGLCELLAAAGLILPGLTGILPWLTPLAAVGLTLVMIGSAVFHGLRHENANVVISVVLVAVSVVVMYGTGVQIAQATATAAFPQEVTLTDAENGQTVEVRTGQTVVIRLKGNITTGYSWAVGESPPFLQAQGDPEYKADSNLTGAPGVFTLRFKVTGSGNGRLALAYRRPFETGVAPIQTYSVQVVAR